jgi:hypothetical protein
MRKLYCSSCLLLLSLVCEAQTNLVLEIQHKLNGADFELLQSGTTNDGVDFQTERLEYYLSGFAITHDGGQVTTLEGVYGLIDLSLPSNVQLGNVNASSIESISFYVGVDEEQNHSDPSSWPANHPLAPKSPSMHWGWAAGYRFIAMEGVETAQNQIFELHGLGDQNYFQVELPLALEATGGETTIVIYANVEEILNNVNLSNGVISHGESGAALVALQNMRDFVFGSPAALSASDEIVEKSFIIYPNPSTDGFVHIRFSEISGEPANIEIRDLPGRLVYQERGIKPNQKLSLSDFNQGIYLLSLQRGSETISTQKLLIK